MPHVSIAIDSEFQSLIPPLSDDEYERLEKSILSEGVRDPIITWNGTIIDGHNRYNICDEHGIPFKTVEREFASREAAKIWIIENQFGRRNLSRYDRSVLALQLEEMYKAEADRKRLEGNARGGKSSQNSATTSCEPVEHFHTDEHLAKLAGTSRDTIRKVKVIETEAAKGNETAIEARDAIKNGEKSIHKAYVEVRPKSDKTDSRPLCVICGEPIDEGDAYGHNQFKHKKCAVIDTETHRGSKGGRPPSGKFAKAQYTEDGRRICSFCGEPIDEGDAYDSRPTMHKTCWNKHKANQRYDNPDKVLLENVATYTIESLLMELQASADSLKESWEESVSINKSMGVSLTSVQKKRLDRAVTNLFKTIQKIREETDNG